MRVTEGNVKTEDPKGCRHQVTRTLYIILRNLDFIPCNRGKQSFPLAGSMSCRISGHNAKKNKNMFQERYEGPQSKKPLLPVGGLEETFMKKGEFTLGLKD